MSDARAARRHVVVFRAGVELFAVDAANVEAVVDGVRTTPLPGFAEHVAGAIRYRGGWALALDVGPPLGVPRAERGTAAVVVRGPGVRYALLADEVLESRAVAADEIDAGPAPAAGDAAAGVAPAFGVDRRPVLLDGGEPVAYIDPVTLFRIAVPDGWEERMTSPEASVAPRPVVAFRVGDQQFGLDVSQVHEVLEYSPPRAVPRAPDFVEGVLDLRDSMIPVVDMRARFELEAGPPGHDARILVISLAAERVGLIVDGVSDVIHLPPDAIAPPPEYFRGLAEEYLDGLARLDDRVLILLRIDRVLTEEQALALLGAESFDEEAGDDADGDAGGKAGKRAKSGNESASTKKGAGRRKTTKRARSKKGSGGEKGGGRSKS